LALAVLPVAVFGVWVFGRRDRWIIAFFAAAVLMPPLPVALGDSGPHLAAAVAIFGLLITSASRLCLSNSQQRVLLVAAAFIGSLIVSEGLAAIYTGPRIAVLGLCRIGLFCIGPLVLANALSHQNAARSRQVARILFRIAILGAAFACADFYFQFPSPAGFGAQFVWLPNEVLRRAQGLFYEASTLGNFCAFFLLFALVLLFSPRELRPVNRIELVLGSSVIGAALILSYSRASLLNLLCSSTVLMILWKNLRKRLFLTAMLATGLSAIIVAACCPTYWQNYRSRLEQTLMYSIPAPDAVLSGRLGSWQTLTRFGSEHPQHLFFGIGYKTLPYSDYLGTSVIADNTYLSLFIETGLVGLLLFLALNFEMLRQSLLAARRPPSVQSLFATLFFCFWVGELVQMLSGDLITYWRVLPMYFWALGVGLQKPSPNLAEHK
jgi:O-antigen ligase